MSKTWVAAADANETITVTPPVGETWMYTGDMFGDVDGGTVAFDIQLLINGAYFDVFLGSSASASDDILRHVLGSGMLGKMKIPFGNASPIRVLGDAIRGIVLTGHVLEPGEGTAFQLSYNMGPNGLFSLKPPAGKAWRLMATTYTTARLVPNIPSGKFTGTGGDVEHDILISMHRGVGMNMYNVLMDDQLWVNVEGNGSANATGSLLLLEYDVADVADELANRVLVQGSVAAGGRAEIRPPAGEVWRVSLGAVDYQSGGSLEVVSGGTVVFGPQDVGTMTAKQAHRIVISNGVYLRVGHATVSVAYAFICERW